MIDTRATRRKPGPDAERLKVKGDLGVVLDSLLRKGAPPTRPKIRKGKPERPK